MNFTLKSLRKKDVIDGKQCTIVWYVDNNNVSHEDSRVVDKVLDMIKEQFGDITVDRGKKHTFLGMNIKLRDDKKIEIEMVNQLQECIDLHNE